MELIDKIKDLIGRLEDIMNQTSPNEEIIREQVDFIENEELINLDEEFDDWRCRLYDAGEPDEETNKLIDEIGDLFVHADELIATIRQHFYIEEHSQNLHLDDDDDDDWDFPLTKMSDDDQEYDIVLNEVSKSAIVAIGIDNKDENFIRLMGTILIGISSDESDDAIAGRAFAQLTLSGLMSPIEEIKEIINETRMKCKKQIFGLQIAFSNLQEFSCSAEDALTQIQWFL